MKFIKLNDAVWINPHRIATLRVLEDEIWADNLLLTKYGNDTVAESDFDNLIRRINKEDDKNERHAEILRKP